MNLTQIYAPQGAFYLTEIPELQNQLPYGIFNKKEPGCGMTHLALTNSEPYIVIVPRVELIKNKINDYIQPVYGAIKNSEIAFYTKYFEGVKKYLCTYDSLPRLIDILKNCGYDAYSHFKLLVDEYHTFLDDYAFRRSALSGCLNEATKFEYVTYGSATPLTPTFTPSLLSGLPVTEIIWPDVINVNVTLKQTPKPYLQAVKVINEYKTKGYYEIDGKKSYEAVLFINSVKTIASIINKTKLKTDEVRVICGKDLRNKDVLGDYMNNNKHARFTFVTSAGYSGIDIESESALTFVFSSIEEHWKTIDITRALHQISGRVRTRSNPFYRQLVFFYSTGLKSIKDLVKEFPKPKKSDYKLLKNYLADLEQWKAFVKWEAYEGFQHNQMALKEKIMELITEYNGQSYEAKKIQVEALEVVEKWRYIKYNEDSELFELDEFRFTRDEFAFSEVMMVYLDGFSLRLALKENEAFDVKAFEYLKNQENLEEKIEETAALNLKTALKEILNEGTDDERKGYLHKVYPEIVKWRERLGDSKLRGLKYNINNIRREYLKYDYVTLTAVRKELRARLTDNSFISSKDLKAVIADSYKAVALWEDTKPAAADITTFFNASKEAQKKINGKNTKGYELKLFYSIF